MRSTDRAKHLKRSEEEEEEVIIRNPNEKGKIYTRIECERVTETQRVYIREKKKDRNPRQNFNMNFFSHFKFFVVLLCIIFALVWFPCSIEGAKKSTSSSSSSASPSSVHHEPVIEEVNQKQLERLLQEKDYVAVYWCK